MPVKIVAPSLAIAFAIGLLAAPLIWPTAHQVNAVALALDKATVKSLNAATHLAMVDLERGCRLSETIFNFDGAAKAKAATLDKWPKEELCLPAAKNFRWEAVGAQDLCRRFIRYTVGE